MIYNIDQKGKPVWGRAAITGSIRFEIFRIRRQQRKRIHGRRGTKEIELSSTERINPSVILNPVALLLDAVIERIERKLAFCCLNRSDVIVGCIVQVVVRHL